MSGFYNLMLFRKKESTFLQSTSLSHIFSTLSAQSMIEVYETVRKFIKGCVSCDILGHIQRRAANSYPPAYPGCHGLQLVSIGLQLGCPQSHSV